MTPVSLLYTLILAVIVHFVINAGPLGLGRRPLDRVINEYCHRVGVNPYPQLVLLLGCIALTSCAVTLIRVAYLIAHYTH